MVKLVSQYRSKSTSWIVPLAYACGALVVGLVFPRIEHYLLPHLVSSMSAPAAMSVASSIASGMIALTGIVFSLTFVMVQFSATAYSPRLVLWVARDPVMSHALGVFIATFFYALMLLGWVDRSQNGRVPLISEWMVFALLLSSMGMFIALIERIGTLQINRMLIFTGDRGRQAIHELYHSAEAFESPAKSADYRALPLTQTLTHTGRPQVIQAFDIPALVAIAEVCDGVIDVVAAVGDTVVESTPLLRIHGSRQSADEARLRGAIEIGDERTFEQDPKYALRLVVDIAIKALSRAINDPTTAVQALDQIEDLLLRLGKSQLDRGAYHDRQGRLRLVVPFPAWEDFLLLALDEIRSYGADSVQVMRRMKALIENLTSVLPERRHAALRRWDERLQGSISRSFADAQEKHDASVADRQGLGIGREEGDANTPGPSAPSKSKTN